MKGTSRQVRRPGRPMLNRPQPLARRRKGPSVTINVRLIVALIVAALAIGWWWQFFRISDVRVTGAWHYPASLTEQAAKSEINSHWWWHNLTTVDTRGLKKQLLASQTQLSDVAISRHWPSKLNLAVTERNPNLIWQTGGKAYLLDGQGVIIGPLGDSSTKLVAVEDTTNLPVKPGATVVPTSFVNFCLALIDLIPKQTGQSIKGFQVPETTSEVYATLSGGYFVKFDTTRQASGEVGDLVRTLAELKSLNQKPSQYIDLRIPDRAYYK